MTCACTSTSPVWNADDISVMPIGLGLAPSADHSAAETLLLAAAALRPLTSLGDTNGRLPITSPVPTSVHPRNLTPFLARPAEIGAVMYLSMMQSCSAVLPNRNGMLSTDNSGSTSATAPVEKPPMS